nr:MAG TPA: hypothetical protein [Crassvirales sp.]
MTEDECVKLMVKDLIEGRLSVAQIADKYCDCGSSELRDSLIAHLESLRRLYSIKHDLKKVLND